MNETKNCCDFCGEAFDAPPTLHSELPPGNIYCSTKCATDHYEAIASRPRNCAGCGSPFPVEKKYGHGRFVAAARIVSCGVSYCSLACLEKHRDAATTQTVEEMFDTLIRAGREPRIEHQPGDQARGEYIVSIRRGHIRPMVRGHSMLNALEAALREAGIGGMPQ